VARPTEKKKVATARLTLARLQAEAEHLRAELAQLHQYLGEARRDAEATRATLLREANEHLVLAALQADRIAEQALSELDELTRSSQHDPLTGTPNRNLMLDRLESAINLARRRSTRIAVFFLDLDNFKEINDTLGHAVGDEILKLVADRLVAVVRNSDAVSRHGGDEFLALLAEVNHATDAAMIAGKMLSAIAAPAQVGDSLVPISASIGIALYPEDGTDATTLIARADAAMYRIKRSGGGRFAFHDSTSQCAPPHRPQQPDGPSCNDRKAPDRAPHDGKVKKG
jgi:diguanylate cyclase (GGDEF)-like protein